MGTVEQALAAWAVTASEDDLDLGPNIEELGGYDTVVTEAPDLALGPQLPYLAAATTRSLQSMSRAQAETLAGALLSGIRTPHSGWVLTETLDVLINATDMTELMPQLGDTLAAVASDALAGRCTGSLASPAISGLLRLAVARRYNRFSLLALLTGIAGTEPPEATEHLPILIGVAHDHFDEPELIAVLSLLHDGTSLPYTTRVDAAFELAISTTRAALQATELSEITRLTRDAMARFRAVVDAQEARLDADAYATALGAVLLFNDHGSAAQVGEASKRLSQLVAQRNAWSGRMYQPSWLEARGLTEAAWSQLASDLATAAARLEEPSWLDAATVLHSVLAVYRSARAIHTTAGIAGVGSEVIVSPPVEHGFLQQAGLLHHLRQLVAAPDSLESHPDAVDVLRRIDDRLATLSARTGDANPPGKAPAVQGRLTALTITDNQTSPELLRRIEDTIAEYERGFALSGNLTMDRQLRSLHTKLSTNSAWIPPTSHHFFGLVTQLLRFLHSRFDGQANLLGSRTAYLGPPVAGAAWLEKFLQDDFYEHLIGVYPPGTVLREQIDVASGRTDIVYQPEPGQRFVIEVKRELQDASAAAIEDNYVAQIANYTATGPPFGILLVGDHTNHTVGYSDLEDRIWITQRSRSVTETPRFIVIAVLPIGRPTPSALRGL